MSFDKVVIPKSHRNEWKSQRDFEAQLEKINMYMPFGWSVRDYGVDGMVELTTLIKESENLRPESKYFLLQLKAKNKLRVTRDKDYVSFSGVPVKKIIQWYSGNIAVMFVVNDLSNGNFYFTWINDDLISYYDSINENWVNQKTVTIRISVKNKFSIKLNYEIRKYVLNWKTSSQKIIQPGVYFEAKNECKRLLNKFIKITSKFSFESIDSTVEEIIDEIEAAIYKISITGPSRVGKSTLINALLKREGISPTGYFQTTGVPIQVLPGKEEQIKVYFKNGKTLTRMFNANVVEEFASQDENQDNEKEVALVVIQISNRELEQGLSYFDIPGLDDPDENINTYTRNTIAKSNAIIYMIDASSAEHGGFMFKSNYKRDILEFGQSLDKIFLVLNKVNALSEGKLELLQERVKKDLKRYDLYDKVSDKIYYISAEQSLNIRINKETKNRDSILELEKDIWSFLLSENKIGLIKLGDVYYQIIETSNTLASILETRLVDTEKRGELEKAIESTKASISEIDKLYKDNEITIKDSLKNSLRNRKNETLLGMEEYLEKIKPTQELPNNKFFRDYLSNSIHNSLEQTNKQYHHQMNVLKKTIDNWIKDNLKDIQGTIIKKSNQRSLDYSEIHNIEIPNVDLSSSFGVGLLAGLVGLIFTPPLAIVTGLVGFLGNFFLSAADRRAKQIDKILAKSRKECEKVFNKMEDIYCELVDENSKKILNHANTKIKHFFRDIEGQLNKLEDGITEEELKLYKNTFDKIKELQEEILESSEALKEWRF